MGLRALPVLSKGHPQKPRHKSCRCPKGWLDARPSAARMLSAARSPCPERGGLTMAGNYAKWEDPSTFLVPGAAETWRQLGHWAPSPYSSQISTIRDRSEHSSRIKSWVRLTSSFTGLAFNWGSSRSLGLLLKLPVVLGLKKGPENEVVCLYPALHPYAVINRWHPMYKVNARSSTQLFQAWHTGW